MLTYLLLVAFSIGAAVAGMWHHARPPSVIGTQVSEECLTSILRRLDTQGHR